MWNNVCGKGLGERGHPEQHAERDLDHEAEALAVKERLQCHRARDDRQLCHLVEAHRVEPQGQVEETNRDPANRREDNQRPAGVNTPVTREGILMSRAWETLLHSGVNLGCTP